MNDTSELGLHQIAGDAVPPAEPLLAPERSGSAAESSSALGHRPSSLPLYTDAPTQPAIAPPATSVQAPAPHSRPVRQAMHTAAAGHPGEAFDLDVSIHGGGLGQAVFLSPLDPAVILFSHSQMSDWASPIPDYLPVVIAGVLSYWDPKRKRFVPVPEHLLGLDPSVVRSILQSQADQPPISQAELDLQAQIADLQAKIQAANKWLAQQHSAYEELKRLVATKYKGKSVPQAVLAAIEKYEQTEARRDRHEAHVAAAKKDLEKARKNRPPKVLGPHSERGK